MNFLKFPSFSTTQNCAPTIELYSFVLKLKSNFLVKRVFIL